MAFQIGDKVTVEGLRAPNMMIIGQTFHDDETVCRCMWFDVDWVARYFDFPDTLLSPAGKEAAPLGMVPVLGYAQ